jgi:hypothetical protein
MKFPVIDFIDIIVDDLKSNNIKIESEYSVIGILNKQKFFKNTILPEISIEEYAQIIFGVFFKAKNNYSNEQLEKIFTDITFYIWCETHYIATKSESCDECYGNGSTTCDMFVMVTVIILVIIVMEKVRFFVIIVTVMARYKVMSTLIIAFI